MTFEEYKTLEATTPENATINYLTESAEKVCRAAGMEIRTYNVALSCDGHVTDVGRGNLPGSFGCGAVNATQSQMHALRLRRRDDWVWEPATA